MGHQPLIILRGTTAFLRTDRDGTVQLSHEMIMKLTDKYAEIALTSDHTGIGGTLEVTNPHELNLLRRWDALQRKTEHQLRPIHSFFKTNEEKRAADRRRRADSQERPIPEGKKLCEACEGIEDLAPFCPICGGDGVVDEDWEA